ncbi:hypothetical protein L1887_53803 [Cichorium endivia]|nr:hypothetical protein L1887_53803 [Cichorium endivia]
MLHCHPQSRLCSFIHESPSAPTQTCSSQCSTPVRSRQPHTIHRKKPNVFLIQRWRKADIPTERLHQALGTGPAAKNPAARPAAAKPTEQSHSLASELTIAKPSLRQQQKHQLQHHMQARPASTAELACQMCAISFGVQLQPNDLCSSHTDFSFVQPHTAAQSVHVRTTA